MLRKLSVENYALIEKLELELSDSLNIITGETGAGKSILLGALSLLLGGRADAAAIMDKERNCVIEGVFSIDGYGLETFFEENDLEYDPQSIIRRVITPAGKSRAYVNDLPVQLAALKELGSRLIDIHSQHQSLMITNDSFRTGIVDSVAQHAPLLADYKSIYRELLDEEREYHSLLSKEDENRRDEDYIRHQFDQLSSANLSDGEQESLETEQGELENAGQIRESLNEAVSLLDNEEGGVLANLKSIGQMLSKLGEVYPHGGEFSERIGSLLIELKDMYPELASECDRIESDPARLEFVNDRLNTIYSLQQKHRVESIAELISLRDDYGARLAMITGFGEAIGRQAKRIAELRVQAEQLAAKITSGRTRAAREVEKYVQAMLARLGMGSGSLAVVITKSDHLCSDGWDNVSFLFSANKNVPPAPLEKVASGGEISRVMLALKSLVARTMKLPTIIFDEIDTGVSGQIADAMGEIIADLSGSMQIVNITHLPQVASKGDTHFYVYKDDSGSKTRSNIVRLTAEERVEAIARMLSGSSVTDAAVAQAKFLLSNK